MYYMLSGVMPEEASQRLVSDRTVPLDQMEGVALPKGWSDAIGKGMSVMAADRYQSIRALREALGESGRTACREHWGQERQEERRRKSLAAGEEELSTERIAGELLQAGKEQESRKERQLIREKALRVKRKIYLRIGLVLIVLVAAGAGIAMMRLNGQAQKEAQITGANQSGSRHAIGTKDTGRDSIAGTNDTWNNCNCIAGTNDVDSENHSGKDVICYQKSR